MDEVKNNQQGNQQSGNNGNGGGRRRRRHSKGKGNSANNGKKDNAVQNSAQNLAQTPANGQKQRGNGNKQAQNAGKQNKPNSQQKQTNAQNPQKKAQPKPQQPAQNNKNSQTNQPKKDEKRKDTYAYELDGNLYINLTNKCSNGCLFCVRNERDSYFGNYLWLKHGDPTVEKVQSAVESMGDLTRFKEVVFCGFGEPTYKVAEMLELCDYFHEKGLKTRLNTNGQGNLINKRDIVPELKGKMDFVSISLNASCAEKYQPICRSQFGENGFTALVEFGKLCRRNGVACRFSIVDHIGEEEVEACKRLAQSVNIPLYIRSYISES